MNDNRAFAAWVLIVVGGAVALLTTFVATGFAALPPLGDILEHAALGLCIRAAYKSTGGWNWAEAIADGIGAAAGGPGRCAEPGLPPGVDAAGIFS